jgi:hypothetical protein
LTATRVLVPVSLNSGSCLCFGADSGTTFSVSRSTSTTTATTIAGGGGGGVAVGSDHSGPTLIGDDGTSRRDLGSHGSGGGNSRSDRGSTLDDGGDLVADGCLYSLINCDGLNLSQGNGSNNLGCC